MKEQCTFWCDFKDCDEETIKGSWEGKVPNGWVQITYLGDVDRYFCSIKHAFYYLSNPIKWDKDPPDDIKQTGITA